MRYSSLPLSRDGSAHSRASVFFKSTGCSPFSDALHDECRCTLCPNIVCSVNFTLRGARESVCVAGGSKTEHGCAETPDTLIDNYRRKHTTGEQCKENDLYTPSAQSAVAENDIYPFLVKVLVSMLT